MTLTPDQARWLRSRDVGVSSLTIFEVMTGHMLETPFRFGYSPPVDASDFGRCRKLLEQFPEWRTRLGEVADRHPAWRAVVGAWDRLEQLHDQGKGSLLYEELAALTDRC